MAFTIFAYRICLHRIEQRYRSGDYNAIAFQIRICQPVGMVLHVGTARRKGSYQGRDYGELAH